MRYLTKINEKHISSWDPVHHLRWRISDLQLNLASATASVLRLVDSLTLVNNPAVKISPTGVVFFEGTKPI